MTTTQLLEGLARCRSAYNNVTGDFSTALRAGSAFVDDLDRVEQAIRIWAQNCGRSGQPFPNATLLWEVLDELKSLFTGKARQMAYGPKMPSHASQTAIQDEVLELQRRLASTLIDAGQISSQLQHNTESSMLEPHTARTCQVKIKIDKLSLVAHSYVLSRRCLYWRNDHGTVIFEHRLSQSTRKCFPYTQHRMFGKPFTVSFLDVQDTVIKVPKEQAVPCRPQYSFLFESDCQLFQSDIRARDLLHEFHVTTIASKNSRGGADAHNEVVKIWDAPAGSADRSISFPAAHSTITKDFELPLKWFNPPLIPVRSNVVRLELASDKSSSDNSSLKSKFNLHRKSKTTTNTYTGSIHSVNTAAASSAYAPPEWLARLGYLDFKLTVPSAVPAFFAAVTAAYAPHDPSRVPSLYSAASESPSTISTAWSASPLSFQNMPHRPSERRPSVVSAGNGPLSPAGMALPDAAISTADSKESAMDLDTINFSLPAAQAGLGEFVIKEDEEGSIMSIRQPQTPSSLLGGAR